MNAKMLIAIRTSFYTNIIYTVAKKKLQQKPIDDPQVKSGHQPINELVFEGFE